MLKFLIFFAADGLLCGLLGFYFGKWAVEQQFDELRKEMELPKDDDDLFYYD